MKISKILLFITVLLLFGANEIQAYDCGGYGTLAEEFKSSAAVFSGRVVAQEYKGVTDTFYANTGILEILTVKIKVDRWWKGSGDSEVIVYPGGARGLGFLVRSGEDFTFTTNRRYLVYARASKDSLQTNDCTRTKPLDSAAEDIKALGEGFLPKPLPNSNSSEPPDNSLF